MHAYNISRIIQGSFNQGNELFGETAGTQCACNVLYAIFWSYFRSLSIWKVSDLNKILIEGDKVYKSLNTRSYLNVDELPRFIETNGMISNAIFSHLKQGEATIQESTRFLREPLSDLIHRQDLNILMIIGGVTLALFKRNNDFYIFDSHGRDEQGLPVPEGMSCLIKFPDIFELEKYIKVCHLELRSIESQYFQIQTIEFSVLTGTVVAALQTEYRNYKRRESYELKQCKEKRKLQYQNNREKAEFDYQQKKVEKNINESKRKMKCKQNKTNKKPKRKVESSVEKFKKSILQGPYFICLCCHRCLYRRSVLIYKPERYKNSHLYCSEVLSFDSKMYVCKTCDKKLKQNLIPEQSVKNNLEIDNFPPEFQGIRRLERVLISRRILFKKIAIMPKGQSPKLKGSICNVPINVKDVVNTLPRQVNTNGIVSVKLKRKLEYRGHVLFETIRPNFVFQLLHFLKNNNPLYSDIEINLLNIPDEFVDNKNSEDIHFEIDSNQIDNNKDIPIENFDEPIPIVIDETDKSEIFKLETTLNPLDEFRSNANETVLMSHMPTEIEIDNEILSLAPGEGKKPISIVNDEDCEMLAHPHLFPKGRFGYKYEREMKISPSKYFNQRLLNYTQKFASDSDYIFYANFVLQNISLTNQINVAMRKVSAISLNAGMLSQNFKETVKQFIANDKAFAFMNSVKGTPAYWKKFLQEVLAMVKQLGPPSFFLTLSCADLRWNELISIIYKLKRQEVSEEFIDNLTYHERCELLNSNPVLVARHFQYRVETFFKHFILNGPLGETVYYAIRVEFQVRGSPHVHSFLWTKNAPNLTSDNKNEYIRHVDDKINVSMPSPQNNPCLHELVRTYQLHRHSKTCRKYKNTNCRFNFGKFFSERTVVSEPLPETMPSEQKQAILLSRKDLLSKVKLYINENLNPSKRNFFDSELENYFPVPTIDHILSELNITKADYENALSISEDDSFHIHLKRPSNSCFVNNYFNEGLEAWEANLDVQPVFNYYKAITYMCAYLSKTEDEVSNAMNQALQEAYENNSEKYHQMKKVANAYVTKREVSVQEAVYLSMPELWLRKLFPAVTFANTNIPDKRFRICLTESELNELPQDSNAIFKQNMLDRYCDRPNARSFNGKYILVSEMCYAEFLRFYTVKYVECKENDCQPNELEDELIETNHLNTVYPKEVPLMSSDTKLKCRKVPLVLRYFEPNQNKNPEDFAHHLLMLYFPFRNENELLSHEHESYIVKVNEPGVLDVINRNKSLVQPYSELVEEALVQFRNDVTLNFNDFEQQENDDMITQIDNSIFNDFEDETDNFEPIQSVISIESILLPDSELNLRIRNLNFQQRNVFDIIHKWGRDFVKNLSCKLFKVIDPFHIFLTGGGGVGKSHLLTTIYHCLTKLLMYKGGEPSKERILILAPTGVAAINVNGTTIHTGLKIPTRGKLFPLSDKAKTSLRLKLSCIEMIMIDEISMVPGKLFRQIDSRLREIFNCDKPFAGKSVLLCGDLYQLPPVSGKSLFKVDCTSIENIIGFELWNKFQMAELTEVMRQRGDIVFIDLLNQVRTGKLEIENEELLKSRFIEKDCLDYPSHLIHIFAENLPVDQYNINMLDKLQSAKHEIYSLDEIPKNVTLSNANLEFIKNAKPRETGGLAFKLELKEGARVMISKNIDIEDKLVNGQVGTVMKFKFNDNKIVGVYINLDDDKAGLNAKKVNEITRENKWILIERAESKFNIKKSFENSPSVCRTQFPLMLSWACTCHKVQGLSLQSSVISFELFRQRQFNAGQMYVALSRVTTLAGLYLIGNFNKNAIKVNLDAEIEYERLRISSPLHLQSNIDFSVPPKQIRISLLNIRSMNKHLIDIETEKLLLQSDLLCLTETQIGNYYDTHIVDETFQNYGINVCYNNNSINRFQNLAICSSNSVEILDCLKAPGFSLLTFKKNTFSELTFQLLLLYRTPSSSKVTFYDDLIQLLNNSDIDFILGDFNMDSYDLDNNHLKNIFSLYQIIVKEPTHLSGGLLDHIYVKNEIANQKEIICQVKNIFFSDHDAVIFSIS